MGQIMKFLQLVWNGNCHQIAIVRKVKEVIENDNFQRIASDTHITVMNISCLQSAVHVVHDCKKAKCHLEGTINKKIEQQCVDVKCLFLKHNLNYKVFIINKCRLTHAFDKFDF